MYSYSAYGLIVASELKLNGLTAIDGVPDITIKFGNVPEDLIQAVVKTKSQQLSHNEFLLNIGAVAKFYVINGSDVIIQKYIDVEEGNIQVFLMGTVFAYILQYRDYLVLHGSAILVNNKAVIFSGNSGAGKSTTAAMFAKKGYCVLTDDMIAIKSDQNNQLKLIPGWPRLKLWQDALDHLQEKSDLLIRVYNKDDKFEFPVIMSSKSCVPISAFYVLNSVDSEQITIENITDKLLKLDMLVKNTFRYYMLKALGKRNLHFKQCGILSGNIKVSIINRPKSSNRFDELIKLIESDMLLTE